MAHQPKKDPFAPIALLIGLAILGTTVFVLVSNLASTISRNTVKGVEDNSRAMAVADESLKPIGQVTAVDKSIAKVARKGNEVYKAVCASCHATGVLGAPKFGSKDLWAPRVANGLPALIKSATDGKGSMPPRGGDPTVMDEELKAAILYMTKEAGFDLENASADTAKKEAAPAVAEKPAAPAQPEAATKPEKPATPTEPNAPAAPSTADVAAQAVVATKSAEKAVEAPVAPKADAKAEESAPTAPAAPKEVSKEVEKAPAAPVAPKEVEKAPAAPKEEKKAEPEKVAEAPKADGKAIYDTVCFACHATGVAGSPIFGNKAVWAHRIATGMDALHQSALNGKGAMPPKGGKTSLSDDEVKAAVDYMVENAK